MKKNKKIIIIGAGPTGLGAAWRLKELGYSNWQIIEKEKIPGGLAKSFKDKKGFTWDIGGHVQHSHYKYFDNLMNRILKNQWYYHERESWIWIYNRFVPYPFQNNIRYLPPKVLLECLEGIIEVNFQKKSKKPKNFYEWIIKTFGSGIAKHFLLPYNKKVWAYHPKTMNYQWVGDRVAIPDLKRILENIIYQKDDVSWGPNNTFRFPKTGGTGAIWQKLAKNLPQEKIKFNEEVINIDPFKRIITTSKNNKIKYDILISTMPLNLLIKKAKLKKLYRAASYLKFSSVYVIGVGLKGKLPSHLQKKCWMYFPENNTPFYRVTVFSNYSPANTPDSKKYWSLMAEVSASSYKKVNKNTILSEVIKGLKTAKLIPNRKSIVDSWLFHAPYGYPTPFLKRDKILEFILPQLEKIDIFSRGRFGGWKYEVSNQDHSVMQGVEIIDRLLKGKKEITFYFPNKVNNPHYYNHKY